MRGRPGTESDTVEVVRQLLTENKEMTTTQLAGALGMNRNSFNSALSDISLRIPIAEEVRDNKLYFFLI